MVSQLEYVSDSVLLFNVALLLTRIIIVHSVLIKVSKLSPRLNLGPIAVEVFDVLGRRMIVTEFERYIFEPFRISSEGIPKNSVELFIGTLCDYKKAEKWVKRWHLLIYKQPGS